MTLTNYDLQREIVAHLKNRSPFNRWISNGMDGYLEPMRWSILDYSQKDYGADGDTNIRIFGIKDASADGKLSGRVMVITTHDDEKFIRIDAVMPEAEKLTASQHDFIALARGEAAWLTDVAAPKSNHPDFGSW
jgi:hypothetical protein